MVESGGLENRCTLTGTVGSNPTLSASRFWILDFRLQNNGSPLESKIQNPKSGEVQEWLNWQHWKCCVRETVPWVRIPPSPPRSVVSDQWSVASFHLLATDHWQLATALTGSGRRAISLLQTPPGRERSNGSSRQMCRGFPGA